MIEFVSYASGSSGNCYAFSDGKTKILIEAGIPRKVLQQKTNFGTSEFEAALISHEHKDHAGYVKDIVRAGIDCFILESTARAVDVNSHRIKIIEPLKQFSIGSLSVFPFPLVHDVDVVGFLVKSKYWGKFVYLTDTAYCPFRFQHLNLIAVEANYSQDILNRQVDAGVVPLDMKKRLLRTHMSLETCLDFLRANDLSRVEAIYLLHLSDENSQAERFKREIQELTGKEVYVA